MDKDTYCIEVCGGKCCTLYPTGEEPVRCPKQAEDGSCYNKRYSEPFVHQRLVVVGQWKSKVRRDIDGELITFPFYCGHIENIIAEGGLPEEIAKQCCYAHPELLEMKQS